MKLKVQTETRTDTTITVTGADLLEIVRSKYPEYFRGADSVVVTFRVPDAEDARGRSIEINDYNPITIVARREIKS